MTAASSGLHRFIDRDDREPVTDGPEALIPEARARQRRRRIFVAATVVAAVAVALGVGIPLFTGPSPAGLSAGQNPAHVAGAPLPASVVLNLGGAARSVALSSNGSVALIGGSEGHVSYVWVFVRDGAGWTQQSQIASPFGADDLGFGRVVALAGNGDVAMIGDPYVAVDHGGAPRLANPAVGSSPGGTAIPTGRVLVFVHSGSTWTQEGGPLTPDDATVASGFGGALALSEDGSTAVIGGPNDNCCQRVPGTRARRSVGAAWVFTRRGSIWTQQGPKLVPPPGTAPDGFGATVAVSADGDTALIGSDRGNVGADSRGRSAAAPRRDRGGAWVFTRTGSIWTERAKLLGSSASGLDPNDPYAVALSASGDTALVGGNGDDQRADSLGAAWFFARTGDAWTQQGPELVAHRPSGYYFGHTVALSANGNTALIGGAAATGRSINPGRIWILTRSGDSWRQRGSARPVDGEYWFDTGVLSANGSTALIANWATAWAWSV